MRLIKNTTELIGIKDPNIIIPCFETDHHIEVQAKLDYPVYETTFLKYPLEIRITGTIYHDGYVWSLYSTGSQTLS